MDNVWGKRGVTQVQDPEPPLLLKEMVRAELFRARPGGGWTDGELMDVQDLIVTAGRNYLALRIAKGDTVASAMAYMAVGTATGAPALGDTTLPGEVKRKALAINSTLASNNIHTCVATFGGAAETISSLQLTEAGIFNHASSGNGTMFQRVTYSSVVLADSDIVKITLETNCGSS